jgi:hypothetical protein
MSLRIGEPACFYTSFATGLRPYSGLLSMLVLLRSVAYRSLS